MQAKQLLFTAPLLFALACGSKGPVAEFEAIVNEICACKDAKCATDAGKKLDALGEKYKSKGKDAFSDKDKAKLMELTAKMTECQQKLTGGSAMGDYVAKSKSTEAKQFIKKLQDGARAYYMDSGASAASLTPTPPQFPGPSIGPTPAVGACCKTDSKKCEPNADQWSAPQWVALSFSVDDPHYFSYKYEVSDDGKSITASAIGDLDCDGTFSTYSLTATVGPDGPTGASKVKEVNPGE